MSSDTTSPSGYSAFFYGTLLHPRVLRRVLGHEGEYLTISPAILEGYLRHKVSWASFPAIITAKESHECFKTSPEESDNRVRGCFISGFTDEDMVKLDYFEGKMYTREVLTVNLLAAPEALDKVDAEKLVDPSFSINSTEKYISTEKAQVYIWARLPSELLADAWTFDDFIDKKKRAWA